MDDAIMRSVDRTERVKAATVAIQRRHLLVIQDSLTVGTPREELQHDIDQFVIAARRLIATGQ